MCNSSGVMLPPEYQQCAFAQSNGRQFVDIGGNQLHKYYDLDFSWIARIKNALGEQYGINGLLGQDGNNMSDVIWLQYNSDSLSIVYNQSTVLNYPLTLGTRTRLYASPTLVTVDGVQQTITASTQSTQSKDVFLFASNNPIAYTQSTSIARVYSLVTDYVDLVPCYHKSDCKTGMYDIKNDAFLACSGASELAVGVPQNKVQLVNYIRSTGTQYINTCIGDWNNTIEYEISLSIEAQSSGSRGYFGVYDQWNSSHTLLPAIGTFTSYRVPTSFAAGFGSGAGTNIGISNGQTGTIALRDNTISWSEGTSTAFNRGSNFVNKETVVICATNGAGTVGEFATTSIYGAKFWLNGNLIRDFKPALLQGIKPGLYDTVDNCFYPNAGTGEFLYG